MSSIFSSQRAIEVLAALEQREGGMRLTEVAEALVAPVSSAQVALGLLVDDGLVSVGSTRPAVYQMARDQDGDVAKILDIAGRRPSSERLLAAALRANTAVEFAGRDAEGLLLVTGWDAEPCDEVLLERMLERLDLAILRLSHDDLRDRLLDDASLRERASHSLVIVGRVDRSFPDPFRHGASDAPFLGDLHPAVRRPSRNALARISRRFGLREMRVFGSAVHADFRPDSDIDVMVRRRQGVCRTLEGELALRRALEDLLGRDVDVVDAMVLRDEVRRKAESEGVVLYG
ncbi:MAG: nucleotidyltransferase domain-containing protein [Candidatus Limnocylindrales bacterium]